MGRIFRTIMLSAGNEVQRNEILETLLRKIAELEEENALLRQDLAKTVERRNECMADADHGAAEISQLRGEIMTLLAKMSIEKPQRPIQENEVFLHNVPFVVVLIDGSASMFEDAHVQQGEKGGREAVRKFYRHLVKYLVERQVFQTHWRLIIKFYASMSSLGTKYLKFNTIDNLEIWRGFINGFNDEYPLCYFIDSGDNQANAENKIQHQLALFFGHYDCQHTVLIGSSNGGYTGFLRQYMKSDDLCGRITVVEAIPFPGEVHDLSSRFLPPGKDSLFPIATATTSCTPQTSPKRIATSPVPKSPALETSNLNPDSSSPPGPRHSIKSRSRASSNLPRPSLKAPPSPASSPKLHSIKSPTRAHSIQPSSSFYPMSSPTPNPRRSLPFPVWSSSMIPSLSLNAFPSPQLSQSPSPKTLFDSAASRLKPQQTPSKQLLSPRSTSISSLLQVPSPNSMSRTRFQARSQASAITPLRDASPSHTPRSNPNHNQTQPQVTSTIKRKPLAETQTRLPLPRPRNTFFDSKGQRVDSKAYVSMYTKRYLDCERY